MDIKEYQVVKFSTCASEFEKRIQERIEKGWQPYGDLKVISRQVGDDTYIQVMVK